MDSDTLKRLFAEQGLGPHDKDGKNQNQRDRELELIAGHVGIQQVLANPQYEASQISSRQANKAACAEPRRQVGGGRFLIQRSQAEHPG